MRRRKWRASRRSRRTGCSSRPTRQEARARSWCSQASRPEAEDALAALPLVAAELIEAEIIELHPFPGLSS